MDTETKVSAVKPGLTTKETFVLDKDYFKIGDIYCLRIQPEFPGAVHMIPTGYYAADSAAALPAWTYAICSDVCDTAVDFTFKRADEDGLAWIQVHAEDIENGCIEVTHQLCNETLNQEREFLNKEHTGYEG